MKSLIVFLGLGLASNAANAACTQADLTGTAYTYVNGTSTDGTFALRCRQVYSSTGNISTSSYCVDPAGVKTFYSSGTLTVQANCKVTGTLTLNGVTSTIVEGAMSRDKITGAGLGTFNGGFFTYSSVKK